MTTFKYIVLLIKVFLLNRFVYVQYRIGDESRYPALSPLTCCNPLSSSSRSFLVFILTFCIHSSFGYGSYEEVPLIMRLNNDLCLLHIIPIRDFFLPPFAVYLHMHSAPSS